MGAIHPARRVRPRRSMLYVPASHARALAKAPTLPADAIIVDLEDAVLPSAKEEAREAAAAALEGPGWGAKERILRVNGLDTPWGAGDLARAASIAKLDAVLVPKVESADAVRAVEQALGDAQEALGIMAMIETPLGVLEAPRIAAASERLVAFVVGTNDLEAATGARQVPGRAPMLYALSACVLAARAHGLSVIDGVYGRLEDAEGLRAECQQGRELGFDGKSLIHPKQIDSAHAAFGPDPEAVAAAERIIAGFEAARARGDGVAVVDGKMVEALHAELAARTVALARGIEALSDS